MSEWRNYLREELRRTLQSHGVSVFMQQSKSLLSAKHSKRGLIVGELAEIIAVELTSYYLNGLGVPNKVFQSVVLKNLKDLSGKFRTELDTVVVTPYFIFTLECKSYYGEVSVTDKCTLTHCGKSTNLYNQNKLHFEHLREYARQLLLKNNKVEKIPVYASAFLFSDSSVLDKRTEKDKKSMRVLSAGTLLDYYDELLKRNRKEVYDFKRACKIFSKLEMSEELHQQHANYVGYKRS